MTKPKICICTLGCKVNQYDSDAMAAVFAEADFIFRGTANAAHQGAGCEAEPP